MSEPTPEHRDGPPGPGWKSFESCTRKQLLTTCYALEAMRDRAVEKLEAAEARATTAEQELESEVRRLSDLLTTAWANGRALKATVGAALALGRTFQTASGDETQKSCGRAIVDTLTNTRPATSDDMDIPEMDLPGAWSYADFTGGAPDEHRGPDWKPNPPKAEPEPPPFSQPAYLALIETAEGYCTCVDGHSKSCGIRAHRLAAGLSL